MLLTYRALHGLAPAYIKELLVPFTPPRTLRSSTEQLLELRCQEFWNCGSSTLEQFGEPDPSAENPPLEGRNSPVSTSVWWPHAVIDIFSLSSECSALWTASSWIHALYKISFIYSFIHTFIHSTTYMSVCKYNRVHRHIILYYYLILDCKDLRKNK